MIYYKTNANWFGDLFHLYRSWTIQKIFRGVLMVGVYTTLVCLAVDFWELHVRIALNVQIFSLLGVILSIFLVFRTNTAYDRWWEGRKQWGALVNNTRNLAVYVHAMFPKQDQEVRRYFAKQISNFCIALVDHLRDGVKLDKLIYLSDDEKEVYQTKGHIPNYIAYEIFNRMAEAHRNQEITEGDYINIKDNHQALLDILGVCERIRRTPVPFSYAVYLKIYITAYAIMLPFALVTAFGWATIPLVMFIFFSLIGVELLGEEIEDPFGLDCNDLPTGDIAHTIKTNVFEILEDKSGIGKIPQRELYEKVH